MMRLNKVLLVVFAFTLSLFGVEISTSYSEGLTAAIKNEKRLFVVIYDSNSVKATSYYKTLINDKELLIKLDRNYQIVLLEKRKDQYPKRYQTKFPTTTFLITPPSEREDEMIIGDVNPIKLLRIALANEI